MVDDEFSLGAELHPPTESRADLAMRARIAARLDLAIEPTTQRIGRYEVVRRIGAGGMGVVYEAHDPQLDRTVALKILRGDRKHEDGFERLRQEARALAKLSHPNVVQIHEIGDDEGVTFVAMELVRGQTLHEWQRSGDRSRAEILAAYREAGLGLAAAHQAGIVHRDFKPSNVLLGDDGRIRVADFGLARSPVEVSEDATPSSSPRGSSTAGVAGTPGYIAPELLAGAPASASSDQFSFCVALWEALTGQRPTAASENSSAGKFVGPAWLRRILLRGLAENPADRWPDLPTLVRALDRRPRRQLWLALALPLLGLGVGLAVQPMFGDPRDPCADLTSEFDAVWTGEVERGVRAQLETLGRTSAEADVLARALDRQGMLWRRAQRDVCEASQRESSWSPEFQEAAQRCLADAVQQSRDLIAVFDPASGDPPVSVRALVAQLDDPRACVDVDALARRPSVGSNEPLAAVRQSIARARLLLAGETERGDAESERLLARARELNRARDDAQSEWLLAETLELRATSEQWRQRPDLAWPLLREAIPLARRSGDIELELRCLHRMGAIAAEQLEQPERAADFLALAEGLLGLLGASVNLEFEHALVRADVARSERRLQDAEAILRAAIDRADDVGELGVQRAQLRLANVIAEQGRLDAALETYLEVRSSMAAELGDSADVGFVDVNIGLTLHEAGERDEEAEQYIRRGLALLERSFGADSIRLAPALIILAEIELFDGRFDEARRDAERAWTLQREQLPEGHGDRGQPLKTLGGAQLYLGDYPAALRTYEQMTESLADADAEELAGIECTRGWLLCRLGRCESARPHFDAALSKATSSFVRRYALAGLANVEIVDGHPDLALERLEELFAGFEHEPVEDAALAAEAEWLFARALVDAGGSRADACAHLGRARELYAEQSIAPDIAEDLEAMRRSCEPK